MAVAWWRRARRIPRPTAATARRSPWWTASPASPRCAASFHGAAASERAVVESNHRGHLSVVTSDIAGKPRVVAERVRWLMAADPGEAKRNNRLETSRVLVLTGNGALASDESRVRAQLLGGQAFYALERQGHGVYSVRDFCRYMLEETGRDQRVFGRAKLAAFLLHHRKELPFSRLHRGNATAPLQQHRHVSDLLQLFRMLEAHGVGDNAFLDDTRERQEALSIELAETYSVYHSLLAKHGISTWDGAVLELLELCGDSEFTASLLRGYTDIVVDDLQSLTPAMVQLVAKLCRHPSIRSSTSVSRVLDTTEPCLRTQQLEQLLTNDTASATPVSRVVLPQAAMEEDQAELRALSQVLWAREKNTRRAGSDSPRLPLSSDVLHCIKFCTVTEEEIGIGNLLREAIDRGDVAANEVAVLAPTLQDAQRIAHSLLSQGFSVRATDSQSPSSLVPSVNDSELQRSAMLFDEPVVNTVLSLLVALCYPTDSRHLYNVLRSDFFAFPAELLSRLMEKEQRSHVDLFSVLETFVATNGASIYPAKEQSSAEVSDSSERGVQPRDVEAGLATARAFVQLVKALRAICHSQSAQEIVHTFLDETGRMESLLNPGSTEEEHEAIVLAEFLHELEGAQRVVQSAYVPLVVPYLIQLRELTRSKGFSPAHPSTASSEDRGELDEDDAIRVLPLTLASLESLAGSNAVSTLVLMSMRDSKFPGRMRRVTLPLPYRLLAEPYPIQTRDEHIERCERLAAFAMAIPRKQVVLSFAAVVSGSSANSAPGTAAAAKLKVEQISRVFLPIWQDPPLSKPKTASDPSDTPGSLSSLWDTSSAASSVVRGASPTIKYNPSHVSYSQISEYLRCPYRYYLARVMKLPGELSTAMMYGRVLHEAVAEFSSALISDDASDVRHDGDGNEQRQVAAENQALAVFAESWDVNQDDALFSSPDHERVLFEQGVVALKAFFQAHKSENPRVLHVEHPFTVFVPQADVELRGVWDRIDVVTDTSHGKQRMVIKEFKSNVGGAARDMAKQARDSLQLKVYMYAFERVFGALPFGAALQIIGGDDKSNAAGFITSSASSAQEAVDTITTVVSAMRAGEFAPQPNYMECAFCPYASSACRAARDGGAAL